MMKSPSFRSWTFTSLLGVLLITATACSSGGSGGGAGGAAGGGGGGGGTPPSASPLTGNWFGTEELTDGSLHPVQLTVDADLKMTELILDGNPSGLTGSITRNQAQIYDFTLSDGSEGGFWIDEAGEHVVFCDSEWNFGVLQKGGSSASSYTLGDLVGRSYSGYTVVTDSSFEIAATGNSSAQVGLDGSFEGNFDGGSAGSSTFENSDGGELGLDSSTYGRFIGHYTESTGEAGTICAIMSPDKELIGTWACPGTFPEDCSFSVWVAD